MRNVRIDIVKGLGILLIVLGHTQMFGSTFVNLFHVGLFFIASGWCFKEKYSENLENVKEFVKKRIKRLYVPFVAWNLIFLVFRNIFCYIGIYSSNETVVGMYGVVNSLSISEMIRQTYKIMLMGGGEQLTGACWFLRALLILEISFVLIDFIIKKIVQKNTRYVRWIIALLILGLGAYLSKNGIAWKYNLSTVCSVWVLYVLGIELQKKDKHKEKLVGKKAVFDILSIIASYLILLLLSHKYTISYDSNQYSNVLVFLLSAISGWIMCWGSSNIIVSFMPIVKRCLVYVGQRTIDIMFLHLLFFKLITYIYIKDSGLSIDKLAAFPVLTNELWPWYFIVSIVGSLIINKIIAISKATMNKKRNLKILIGLLISGMLASVLGLGLYFIQYGVEEGSNELDYGLVYNMDEYLFYNQDIKEAYGDRENEIFTHFLQYGMQEGRRASSEFDLNYYMSENADLAELYGDDYEKYYLHYLKYGYAEGRSGSVLTENNIAFLKSRLLDRTKIIINWEIKDSQYIGKKGYIFRLAACEEYVDTEECLWEGILEKNSNINVELNSLTDKYVLAIKKDNKYSIISNFSYVVNPEIYSNSKVKPPIAKTKKGLQCTDELLEDTLSLNVSHVFRNLVIQQFMKAGSSGENEIVYNYKGEKFYFNKNEIEKLDSLISAQTKAGIVVTASIVSIKTEGYDSLYYDGINMDTAATYYALNTADEEGLKWVEAFVNFMSKRYDGSSESKGMICNWVVGNEVNESGTYNYMGEKEILMYIKEYTRTFRVVYNIIKGNIPTANVYVPMEPWWGIDSNMLTYGGKEFLDLFNTKMKEGGNIDWGLAYHAYSYPLSDPKVLNDNERSIDENGELTLEGYVSSDQLNSVFISMENIEVLVDYMMEEKFLTESHEVRSIILSEQGYTSNSNVYGNCEALQAASMVYAYYKTEMNPDIDAFIYFLQMDNTAASLGNNYYLFGLMSKNDDGKINKKMAYDIYKIMDGNKSLVQLEYIKDILDISSWEDVIQSFNKRVFDDFKEYEIDEKCPIENAIIDVIPTQRYTGEECLPEPIVFCQGQLLVNDRDYDVVYHDNIDCGQAKALVVGMNKYSGIKTVYFYIQ